MAKLTLAFKDKKLKIFPLMSAELVVGRNPDCAIHIDSLAVQPRHARVFNDGHAFCVEGMQAEEPVLVNHILIAESTPLHEGDQIQIGKHTLSFSAEALPVEAPVARPLTGCMQVMSGSHLGRTINLDRPMVRIGKTGKTSAIISRRPDGYHIAHLEGDTPPLINQQSIGDNSQRLRDGDSVQIGKLELNFYTDGGAPSAAEADAMQQEQRRFTRIAFDAAALLLKDGKTWPCTLIDLSLKGALVTQPEGWDGKTGEEYQLNLTLDEDVCIKMDISISHIEENHVGLYCKDIDLDSITHLRRLVELNLGDANLLERELMALG